jgi:glycosyltransferase involved in cell wall biosynthesis
MNAIKLSICIATLNRGNFIGETLESIVCQASDDVEIVVLDGASTDNTGGVVRQYQERFTGLRYFCQKTSMGVDHDFAEAVNLAQGEYCWLFSDDDLLKPGAIRTVLEAIKGQYALIIANSVVCNADLSKVLQPQRLPFRADRIYEAGENHRLLADTGDYLSFIGCVIIKRELWDAREKEKYFGSFFVHVGVIFQSLLPERALVIAKPLITIRYGNASWLKKYFEIWMFKWPNLIWSFEHYPDAAKRPACHKEPWRRLRALLLHRAKGTYTIDTYLKWLKPRLESSWARAASRAMAHFPGRIANLLAVAYYLAPRRGRPAQPLVLVDLMNSPFYFGKLLRPRSARSKLQSATNPSQGTVSQRPTAPDGISPLPLGKNDGQST